MKKVIVIKMGGVASDNLTKSFFKQVEQWQNAGKKVVIVHGGGHYISEMMQRLNVPVVIQDGLRVTTEETLKITRMVLIGQVQPMITTHFQQEGFSVVGLNASCGQIITGTFLDKTRLGSVGEVKQVDTELLEHLLETKHIPIIAPLGLTKTGEWLNINADHVACKVAEELQAEQLYLLTDVPGVKKENQWLKEISTSDVPKLKTAKIIKGGMLPKLESAVTAIKGGVKEVHITNQIQHAGTIIKGKGVFV
ncbi:acetylglutamate kinase [Enterococcus moraviensis ATCC BAA-383]|uniref:Acetylglutamate kinase n=1 Tax=Enterococcus moraviensis ATCC BAA-383 TaxID=1158609 RepID=R2T334_9ENTE|nr:acetylglutamate kinase [Enterococcus moraviensis]EOI01843.1 acetylglutamate kinase [Enterococcus moraviensis ATCC BAA-383]EOT73622.1 acetylglutamate kinase [Enterococcus moraviensis ATCC BAA-383]OJG69182.1 acetylglutamate kinase [Enterococcus moraviensis]